MLVLILVILVNSCYKRELKWALEKIAKLKKESHFLPSFIGGLYVGWDSSSEAFTMVDQFSHKSYFHNNLINRDRFNQQVIIDECGLTYSYKLLNKTMGKQDFALYLRNREEYFNAYKLKQFSSPKFPLAGINQLLQRADLQIIDEKDFQLERFQLRDEKKMISNKIEKITIENQLCCVELLKKKYLVQTLSVKIQCITHAVIEVLQ